IVVIAGGVAAAPVLVGEVQGHERVTAHAQTVDCWLGVFDRDANAIRVLVTGTPADEVDSRMGFPGPGQRVDDELPFICWSRRGILPADIDDRGVRPQEVRLDVEALLELACGYLIDEFT